MTTAGTELQIRSILEAHFGRESLFLRGCQFEHRDEALCVPRSRLEICLRVFLLFLHVLDFDKLALCLNRVLI